MTVQRNFRRAWVAIGGGLLILLGLVGLALPVMPGTVFLIVGLLLWSTEFPWAKDLLVRTREWLKARTNGSRTGPEHQPPPERAIPGKEALERTRRWLKTRTQRHTRETGEPEHQPPPEPDLPGKETLERTRRWLKTRTQRHTPETGGPEHQPPPEPDLPGKETLERTRRWLKARTGRRWNGIGSRLVSQPERDVPGTDQHG